MNNQDAEAIQAHKRVCKLRRTTRWITIFSLFLVLAAMQST